MSSGFFCWKAKTIAPNFDGTKGSNSDVSNDVLTSQQYQKPANNIKNQQPTISKTSQQYQKPATNNINNQPTISKTSRQQCQEPATK